ncbi:amylo-alpha-1,6-glucosidase [Vulcaniibacterium tengchongense]|uniref:Glycogen debranching enzyme n=1 Tax=Vulcaniibacterium tengchongense TaxID=1273429 RepID=A0A3N4VV42_9GAMM|nr:amylo-alpha-1,6-glucosidase [Vulcaniibacterium tengchongense]RPE80917.1 glycogen debranching enzyme [Vulcaniibacterium tengchongense]
MPTTIPGASQASYSLKDGDTFLVCDALGDISGEGDGLFHEGTRTLSRLRLRLDGDSPTLLSAAIAQDKVLFNAHLTNRPLPPIGGNPAAQGVIHIERTRFLWKGRLYESIACTNYAENDVFVPLQIEFGADFRDLFEVRGLERAARGRFPPAEFDTDAVVLRYDGLDGVARSTTIAFSEAPTALTENAVRFERWLPPRRQFELYLEIGAELQRPGRERFRTAAIRARRALRARRRSGARLRGGGLLFDAWLERSRIDIALLASDLPSGPYPYAGIPWFSTPFGRDAVITALQTLWIDPALARGVLAFLAERQAREESAFRDSAPGKIMHEARKGEMAALGEVPFGLYYGGVDTTPLFVLLAGEYFTRDGDRAFLDALWPALLEATAWIERNCDADADGLLSYARGEATGLANQGWKDSDDSVFHEDGRMPVGPIALVEVQGYAFAALQAMAELSRLRGDLEGALRWRARAERIRTVVEARFWDEALDFYALARDGEGRMCRVRASNPGHLLYVGLPDPNRAQRVIAHLCSPAFDNGWGVRTLASDQPRYNPMSYHNGSVWPHDVALCAAGMARYGARRQAMRLLGEVFEAATHFGMRLPELFCGFPRMTGEPPIAYPVACLPQAWSAGSVFMLLQACLGLRVDAWRGEITVDHPHLPWGVDRLRVERLDVGGTRVDLMFERVGDHVLAARVGGARDVAVTVRM